MDLKITKPTNIDHTAILIASKLRHGPGAFASSFMMKPFLSSKRALAFSYKLIANNEIWFASCNGEILGFFALDHVDGRFNVARPHVHFWRFCPEVLGLCRIFLDLCRDELKLKLLKVEIASHLKKPQRLVEHFGAIKVGEIPNMFGFNSGVLYYLKL